MWVVVTMEILILVIPGNKVIVTFSVRLSWNTGFTHRILQFDFNHS